jgi:hypothetical protein
MPTGVSFPEEKQSEREAQILPSSHVSIDVRSPYNVRVMVRILVCVIFIPLHILHDVLFMYVGMILFFMYIAM